MKKTSHFEEDMKQLEDIVSQISKGSLSLEKSIDLFEKGMALSKKCSNQLSLAEKKVQKIINSNTTENIEVEDFSPDNE